LMMSCRVYMNFMFSIPMTISFMEVRFKTTMRAAS
jgi:hypothetical protein